MSVDLDALEAAAQLDLAGSPIAVDNVAVARLYGEPLFAMPQDLYIPPDALEVFLEAFEGPLDLLLYLIRKQNFNILDIPMAGVTRQYLVYVEEIRGRNLELAAEYLLMAAMLIEIKSRMLLPPRKAAPGEEAEDPRAELVRRLLEYERIKLAAAQLNTVPQIGRDFLKAQVLIEQSLQPRFPDVDVVDLRQAWADILQRAKPLFDKITVGIAKDTRKGEPLLSVKERAAVLKELTKLDVVEVRGLLADFVKEQKITAAELWTRHPISTYLGRTSRVRVTHTYLRGAADLEEGRLTTRAHSGQFLKPSS